MKQVLCWGQTCIRRHLPKFSHLDNLAPGTCVPWF